MTFLLYVPGTKRPKVDSLITGGVADLHVVLGLPSVVTTFVRYALCTICPSDETSYAIPGRVALSPCCAWPPSCPHDLCTIQPLYDTSQGRNILCADPYLDEQLYLHVILGLPPVLTAGPLRKVPLGVVGDLDARHLRSVVDVLVK